MKRDVNSEADNERLKYLNSSDLPLGNFSFEWKSKQFELIDNVCHLTIWENGVGSGVRLLALEIN